MQEARLHLIGQNKVMDLNGGQFAGFRNKIIGGDFSTNPWQRGNNFPAVNAYTADRWVFSKADASTWTVARDNSVAPTVNQAGKLVVYNLLAVCTTADSTVSPSDFIALTQSIEGYNFAPLAQRPMVLSFWHFHSKVGTYCVAFRNGGANQSYVDEYQQKVANTWEFTKIVVPPSPAAGTWNYLNGLGLTVSFVLLAGANNQTSLRTWIGGGGLATVNQVNGADTVNNSFRFALIQLESGVFPTPFEDRTFNMELQLCQRYYEKSYNLNDPPGTNGGGVWVNVFQPIGSGSFLSNEVIFRVRKRAVPSLSVYEPTGVIGLQTYVNGSSGAASNRNTGVTNISESGFQMQATLFGENLGYGHWVADAEL